jgi:polysaccharide pyruvyl transferase WcaK-like protein
MSEALQLDGNAVAVNPYGHTAVVDFSNGAPTRHSDPALDALLRGLSGDHEAVDLNQPVHSLRKADSIVVVNPQFIGADTSLSRMTSVATRAKMANKPLALLAVTAWMPRSWAARKMIRMLIARSDLTLVADEASADVLGAIGIEPPFRLGADPTWASLADLLPAHSADGNRVVWVSSNNLDNSERYVDRLATILGPLAATGLRIQLQPVSAERSAGLADVATRLSTRLGTTVEVLPHSQDVVAAREMYAGSHLVVATEKRSLMAAAASGAPTIAVTLSPETRRMADNLGVWTLRPIDGGDAVTDMALKAVAEQCSVDPALVLQNIDRARASIALVRMLLSQGAEVATDAIESLPLYPQAWRS